MTEAGEGKLTNCRKSACGQLEVKPDDGDSAMPSPPPPPPPPPTPPPPPQQQQQLSEFGRFHVLVCALGFLTMLYATLITLSGMFLNLTPFNCSSEGGNSSYSESDEYEHKNAFRSSISQQYRLCKLETGDLTNVAFFAGTMIGSLLGGPASDAIGRARCALIGQALLAAASLASNYAPSLALHLAARGIAGCCLMPAQCAVQVYGCELHSNSRRGRFIAAWSTGISVGTLAAGGLAWATLHHQLYVLVSCCTAVPSLLLLGLCLPESPVWLAARGRQAGADAALRRINFINGGAAAAAAAASPLYPTAPAADEAPRLSSGRNNAAKFRNAACALLRPMSVLGLHGLCLGLNCVGFYFVLSRIIPNVCLYAAVLGATQLPYAFVLNLIPRRGGLIGLGLLSGLSCLAFGGVARFLPGWPVVLASLGVVGAFCSSAAFSLLVALSAEFFPTELRSTGLGLCVFSLRSGSALAPLVAFLPGGVPVQSLALACPLLLSNIVLSLALASQHRAKRRRRRRLQLGPPLATHSVEEVAAS